jgi:hypothetical protein
VTDIPTATGHVETVRKAFRNQGGRVGARYRTVIEPCPRCKGRHVLTGAVRNGLASVSCGLLILGGG